MKKELRRGERETVSNAMDIIKLHKAHRLNQKCNGSTELLSP